MIGIVPYTLSLIVPLEVTLLTKEVKMRKTLQVETKIDHQMDDKAERESSEKNAVKTKIMIRRWAKLNYGRMILSLIGVMCVLCMLRED